MQKTVIVLPEGGLRNSVIWQRCQRRRFKWLGNQRTQPSAMMLFVTTLLWALGNFSLLVGLASASSSVGSTDDMRFGAIFLALVFLLGTFISLVNYYGSACTGRHRWLAALVGVMLAALVGSTLHVLFSAQVGSFDLGCAVIAMWTGVHAAMGLVTWMAMEAVRILRTG